MYDRVSFLVAVLAALHLGCVGTQTLSDDDLMIAEACYSASIMQLSSGPSTCVGIFESGVTTCHSWPLYAEVLEQSKGFLTEHEFLSLKKSVAAFSAWALAEEPGDLGYLDAYSWTIRLPNVSTRTISCTASFELEWCGEPFAPFWTELDAARQSCSPG